VVSRSKEVNRKGPEEQKEKMSGEYETTNVVGGSNRIK